MSIWIKYAIPVIISLLASLGIYYSGYMAGKHSAELKVVTEKVEVVKYVEKQKAKIYSEPDANREQLLDLMKRNIL